MPMHEVTPKLVAMAVSTVMIKWSILLQVFLFSMIFDFFFISFMSSRRPKGGRISSASTCFHYYLFPRSFTALRSALDDNYLRLKRTLCYSVVNSIKPHPIQALRLHRIPPLLPPHASLW